MVNIWLQTLRHRLLPTTCRLCRAPGRPGLELCADCQQDLPWLEHACSGCAIPLPSDTKVTLCGSCQADHPALDHCRALFSYQNPIDRWIQGLKFHKDLAVARLIGTLLADALPACEHPQHVIALPVPLHRKRLSERGYNQALEIARSLRAKGYQLEPGIGRRQRATLAQSGLPGNTRKHNMRGAFAVSRRLDGQHVLLIDDVMTTGATLNELARMLKNAGAERVQACVIARTPARNTAGQPGSR